MNPGRVAATGNIDSVPAQYHSEIEKVWHSAREIVSLMTRREAYVLN
jgi:hypothetical protein